MPFVALLASAEIARPSAANEPRTTAEGARALAAPPPGEAVGRAPAGPSGDRGTASLLANQPDETERRFLLTAVIIQGSTAYSAADLTSVYQDKIATRIGLSEVEEIAARIAARYEADGLLLVRVQPRISRLDRGILILSVYEGFIESVVVDEGGELFEGLVRETARGIVGKAPLERRAFERSILLINDLPGMTASATVKPRAGDLLRHDLHLRLRRTPYQVYSRFDNRHSDTTGPLRLLGSLRLNSPFGDHGRAVLSLASNPADPAEFLFGRVAFERPLGRDGVNVFASFARGRVEDDRALRTTDPISSSTRLKLGVRYPWIRSRDLSLSSQLAGELYNRRTRRDGRRDTRDRIRLLEASADLRLREPSGGRARIRAAVRQGLDLLDATTAGSAGLSRRDGESDATTVRLDLGYRRGLPAGFYLRGRGRGQFALDRVLSSEEVKFGALRFGRGFDPAEIGGEHGMGLDLELGHERRERLGFFDRQTLYVYGDTSVAWDVDRSREFLSSAGAGVRLEVSDWLDLAMEAAVPLDFDTVRPAEVDSGPQVRFELSVRF